MRQGMVETERRRSRALRGVLGLVMVLSAAGLLAACGSSGPATTALPTLRSGCASEPSAPFQAIPVAVDHVGAGQLAVVGVCLDGKGPYPFVVSTGVGASVVSPSLAQSLGLAEHGGPQSAVRGVTCVATAPAATVSRWSMGGVRLASQSLLVASVPSQGLAQAPDGILGADVLSRFGAIRIDYQAKRLVVAEREAAAPGGNVYLVGQGSQAPPVGLMPKPPSVSVALRVLENPAGTILGAPVTIAGHAEQFAVDTGSAGSSVSPTVASALHLSEKKATADPAGPGCQGKATGYSSGAWKVGTASVDATSLVRQAIPGTVNQGLGGVLGADVLSRYGAVAVDYGSAHLWLGPG